MHGSSQTSGFYLKDKRKIVATLLLLVLLVSPSPILMVQTSDQIPKIANTYTLGLNSIVQFSSSAIRTFPLPTNNSGPNAIVAGPNGTMWFTEFEAGKIGEFFVSNESFREFTIPAKTSWPDSLAIDQFGTIWFSDYFSGKVWSLNTTSGAFEAYQIPTPDAEPLFVLVDNHHNVWFTEATSYKIGELAYPNYSMSEYALPNSQDEPLEMTLDQNTSTIWVSIAQRTTQAGMIASFNMTSKKFGQIYSPPFSLQDPVGIVLDKYGNVWVSEHRGSSITELDPTNSTWKKYPTSLPSACYNVTISAPATLALDSQGNLWFVEHFANLLGKLNPSTGIMQEFNIPGSPCLPYAYSVLNAVDPNGNFWFTDYLGNSINMIPRNVSTGIATRLTPQSNSNGAPTVEAGQSVPIDLQVTNLASTSQFLSLNVSSSFSVDGSTLPNEYSFNITGNSFQLSRDQSKGIQTTITPDPALPSGIYSVSIIFAGDNSSTVQTFFIKVNASPLYFFYHIGDYFQYIIVVAILVLAALYISFRQRRSD
jgi:virginiamycin B lyase